MEEKTTSNWTCPNDRELMLRARLDTGWCCKSNHFQSLTDKNEIITEQERKIILDVLSRAQRSEEVEKLRISKMNERLRNMKNSARGDGFNTCVLCGEAFGFFTLNAHLCSTCGKCVCDKCGIDTINHKNETIWFCKICSETTEIYKKSGTWFYQCKNISKY